MEDHNTQVELTENEQKVFLPLHILEVPSTHLCQETVYRSSFHDFPRYLQANHWFMTN
jgi:hypothetical protein